MSQGVSQVETGADPAPAASERPVAEPVVELEDVAKRFGERDAVSGLCLRVRAGSCFGLLGPNGAGKTTTLRMIYGVTRPSRGRIRVFGLDVEKESRAVRARLGVTLQEDVLIETLSAADNLRVFGGYHLLREPLLTRRIDELMDFLELRSHAGLPVAALSGGYKRRLSVAMSLLNQPDLLILDEPTTGLDPAVRLALWSRVRALRAAGTTVLLTTHYMDEAQRLCDRVAIMNGGRVVCEGSPEALIGEYLAREVVEIEVDGAESMAWAKAAPDVRATLRSDDRLMLFAADGARIASWLRAHESGTHRLLVVRPSNLEDVFLRVTGARLEEGLE